MVKFLPLTKAKARLSRLINDVVERGEEIVVTRDAKPAAVIVAYSRFERLKETLDVLSDRRLMRQIEVSRAFYASGKKGLSFEDVFGEPLRNARRKRR